MEREKMTEKEICEILDYYCIEAYIVKKLDDMAGHYVVVFPIGAQEMRLNDLERLEIELLEFHKSVDVSINRNNIVILLI